MNIETAIKRRRSHKAFDGREVPLEKVQEWLKTSTFAPNHRRNEPWRFMFVEHSSLETFWGRLSPLVDQVLSSKTSSNTKSISEAEIAAKKEKMGKLYAKAGALVFITSKRDQNPLIDQENYGAVCCLTQNLMLLAEAEGIGSFWSTNKVLISETASNLIGYDYNEFMLAGAIFLGHPLGNPVPPKYTFDDKMTFWSDQPSTDNPPSDRQPN